jgi:hypothetical protein
MVYVFIYIFMYLCPATTYHWWLTFILLKYTQSLVWLKSPNYQCCWITVYLHILFKVCPRMFVFILLRYVLGTIYKIRIRESNSIVFSYVLRVLGFFPCGTRVYLVFCFSDVLMLVV